MSDNLALWHQVERTDPAHVKAITGKAYKGNSPKPHFLIFKATEAFGPCGIGWGFEIIEEKLLDGALIAPDFHERIHMARVRVWYKWNGERGTVEHVGQTAFSGKRKSGETYTDEDAPKKSVTDALIKALSMIGFAGDIFMGRYDDSKYVADLTREIANERRAASEPATPFDTQPEGGAKADYIAAVNRQIAAGNDPAKLIPWWNSTEEKQARRDFELSQDEATALKNVLMRRIEALSPQREAAQ